ncbi:Uncharacterised protein [Vibrio cholerae]|nr:Uncharacterised protein [Vibrio cholerae]
MLTINLQDFAFLRCHSRQIFTVTDVAPIVLTRVGQHQVHIDMLPHRTQRINITGRQRRNTEDEQALRPCAAIKVATRQLLNKTLIEVGTVINRVPLLMRVSVEFTPQNRLPRVLVSDFHHVFPCFPT